MRIGRFGLFVAAIVVANGCASSGPKPAGGTFSIDHPAQGAIVDVSPVEVGGSAPAGARIVQDISFGADKDAVADTGGRWAIIVELEEGANTLVFRLGDDNSTEIKLGLTYAPGTQPSAVPTLVAIATVAPTIAAPTSGATVPPVTPTPTPTPAPTAPPATPESTPKPTPEPPTFRTFGDGIWEVGVDIKPGTYRLREPADCYWARLKGFDGSLSDIITNELMTFAYGVVTIKSTDVGFESDGCYAWSSDLSQVTNSKSAIDWDGTYIVGTDLSAGKWKSTGGDSCYWARLSGFTGTTAAIIANALPSGPTIVTIRSTDKGFTTTGCGTWTRQ